MKLIEPNSVYNFEVTQDENKTRLDTFISKKIESYSRSALKKIIENNLITVNGRVINKGSYVLKENDRVVVTFPAEPEPVDLKKLDKDLGVELIYEHKDFLIINKPAGLIVHKANSSAENQVTLVDWLLHKFKEIKQVGVPERPGIVHRLDMLTSGIMVIPRNNYSMMKFSQMFKDRLIKKTYMAFVEGRPEKAGSIVNAIGRHPSGHKMAHVSVSNKKATVIAPREAVTNYEVIKYFKDYSLVKAMPLTGRTHQIRVHFAAIGHPLLADLLYGKKSNLISRQALHAYELEFDYEGEHFNFKVDMPKDMLSLVR